MAVKTVGISKTGLDRSALALEVYAETLSAFERKNIGLDLITKQTIDSGKSVQFIVYQSANPDVVAIHNAGDSTIETGMAFAERNIVIERPIYVKRAVDNYEAKMAHYDTRNPIVNNMGESLGMYVDNRIFQEIDDAQDTVALVEDGVTIHSTAGVTTSADLVGGTITTVEAQAQAIMEAIFEAVGEMDGRNIMGDKVFVTTPKVYNILVQGKAIHADYNAGFYNGTIAMGELTQIAGVIILWSNALVAITQKTPFVPSTLTGTLGYMFTRDVVGLVEFMGMSTDEWEDKDERNDKMLAEYAMGADVLNPECLQVINGG